MAYRLLVNKKEDGKNSLYNFLTKTVNGVVEYEEFSTDVELDTYIEDVLNKGLYKKTDLIPVEVKDYSISADIV